MPAGTVKWYSSQKGYGFILPDEGGSDVFVHATALEASSLTTLNEDQRILYDIETNKRTGKPAAINLREDTDGKTT